MTTTRTFELMRMTGQTAVTNTLTGSLSPLNDDNTTGTTR